MSEGDRIRRLYEERYAAGSAGARHWDPRNPRVVYQRHVVERALIGALNAAAVPLEDAEVLDVGCGGGPHLRLLQTLGAQPERLHGIDLTPARIEAGLRISPWLDLRVGDAADLPWPDATFDVAMQFVALCNITDPPTLERAAAEMRRVLRPGGHVVWWDIARSPASAHYRGIGRDRILELFPSFEVRHDREWFFRGTEIVAERVPGLAAVLERVPALPRTHLSMVLRKPAA